MVLSTLDAGNERQGGLTTGFPGVERISELAFPEAAEYFLITSKDTYTQPSSLVFLAILCKLLSSATRKRGY